MRYTTRTDTRKVPVQQGGVTHLVDRKFKIRVPKAPRDWDAIALRAVYAGSALAVAGAVTWSTVAIGDLLSGVAPTWAAYTVAGVFDLAWIVCMILEWLSRYDRSRAKTPVRCGWMALAGSVSLIAYHGDLGGSLALGVCGGAVSVLAKGMWTVAMRHSAVEMDPDSKAWLEAERASVNSRLAVTAARRQLTRTESRTAAEALALSAGQPDTWTAEVVRDTDSGQGTLSVPLDSLTAPDLLPRTSRPDSWTVPASDMTGRLSHRAFVRGLLSADPGLSNQELSSAVRSEYGQDTKTDSIAKAISRARGDLSRPA